MRAQGGRVVPFGQLLGWQGGRQPFPERSRQPGRPVPLFPWRSTGTQVSSRAILSPRPKRGQRRAAHPCSGGLRWWVLCTCFESWLWRGYGNAPSPGQRASPALALPAAPAGGVGSCWRDGRRREPRGRGRAGVPLLEKFLAGGGGGGGVAKRLPHALIVGVKKGGTRAVLEFIRGHPAVRALGTESHFFDRHYDRGLEWYRRLMPRTQEGQITLEKTPSYFVTREAPRRIFAMSRETKIVVVVRNPVTRAISDYTQTLLKKPDLPAFEGLSFRNRSRGLVDASWSAIRIGLYALHLESWLRFFPLAQIHFVSGERLITDPAGEVGKVQDFLGLRRVVTAQYFHFNSTKGFPCLKRPEESSAPRCLGKSKGRPHPAIDRDVVRRLRKFYKPFNAMFYQMTGQDFRWEQEEEGNQ